VKAGGFADQKKVSISFVLGERFIVGFRPGCGSTAHGFVSTLLVWRFGTETLPWYLDVAGKKSRNV